MSDLTCPGGTPWILDVDEMLLAQTAEVHGTPVYIYHLGALKRRVAALRHALSGFPASLYFATMANDHPRILRELADAGLGACVNSMPHLRLALAAGFPPTAIQFTSTGITRPDLSQLRDAGVRVNLDSIGQVRMWAGVGGVSCGIRINAASLGETEERDRIGIAARDLEEVIVAAKAMAVDVVGLHVYVGTNFQHHTQVMPTLREFFALSHRVPSIEYLNIGGGIGVDYAHQGAAFDLRAYGSGLRELHRGIQAEAGKEVEVVVEPGRGLIASSGIFLSRVTDVKSLSQERFVATDASVAVFPRPLHHPDTPHRIHHLRPNRSSLSEAATSRAVVVGRTTFSRDILGVADLPVSLAVDDLLLFEDAGAYSQSMSSRFLGQPEPAVVFME